MVTNRDFESGANETKVKKDGDFDCFFDYSGEDGFVSRSKRGFELSYIRKLRSLRDRGISNPKGGIFLCSPDSKWNQVVRETVEIEKVLSESVGFEVIVVGCSWIKTAETNEVEPSFVNFMVELYQFLRKFEEHCFATSFCIAAHRNSLLLAKVFELMSKSSEVKSCRFMFDQTLLFTSNLEDINLRFGKSGSWITRFSRHVNVYYKNPSRLEPDLPSNAQIVRVETAELSKELEKVSIVDFIRSSPMVSEIRGILKGSEKYRNEETRTAREPRNHFVLNTN